jgi:uncharacterized Tic20 family protein
MPDQYQKNIATFIHLSTFSRFIVPFGNFIGPVVMWILHKEKSKFLDYHGKQIINFQISLLIYALILGAISIPFILWSFFGGFDFFNFGNFPNFHLVFEKPSAFLALAGGLGVLGIIAFIVEIILIIVASLAARDGKYYHYPFTINFIK